jgi:signal transduction histidine kinase
MTNPLRSPTPRLVAGLVITLAAIATFSYYSLRQIAILRDVQTRLVDRNRRDSLQLLRIQNDLQLLGLALRDMTSGDEPYPMTAWKSQFDRIRADLDDAVRLEAAIAPDLRRPAEQEYFTKLLSQLWISLDQMFERAQRGDAEAARALVRNSLQAQQSSLATTVARLLVQNNESEEQAARRVQTVYALVERNTYFFIAAVVVMIVLTSTYLIYSNRQVFEHLEQVSEQRSELARKLISVQEEVLWSISRELHDEFGQILTAVGAMLARAEHKNATPELQEGLHEVREVVQEALDKTRSLSQALHPAILDTGGLDQAISWYVPVFEKQTGIVVQLEKQGDCSTVSDHVAIHVYRILQEALNNVARHAQTPRAWVRVRHTDQCLQLEVEDHGIGVPAGKRAGRGIGMIGMQERAELVQGRLEFSRPEPGGTLVQLEIPLGEAAASRA